MHEPVLSRIEDYLDSSTPIPEVESHLQNCVKCREEVAQLKLQHEMFAVFRAPEQRDPSAGFYARVMNRIETQTKPSIWNLFGESAFATRLAYASMSAIILMGSYLVATQPTEEVIADAAPEAIFANNPTTPKIGDDPQYDREVVLVNLATYQSQDIQ